MKQLDFWGDWNSFEVMFGGCPCHTLPETNEQKSTWKDAFAPWKENHLPIIQWFCPHTLGRYPKLSQNPTKKGNPSSTAGETSGGIFRGYVGGILESSRVRLAVYMQVVGWLGYLDLNLKPRTSTWNDLQTLGFSNSKFPEYFKSNLTIPSEK